MLGSKKDEHCQQLTFIESCYAVAGRAWLNYDACSQPCRDKDLPLQQDQFILRQVSRTDSF